MERHNDIHLEGERATKLHDLLADIYEIAISLATAAQSFPSRIADRGQMNAVFTVESFAHLLEKKASTAMDMATGDDLAEAEQKGGGAS